VASRPETSTKAFLLGGIAWFGIPMGISTSLGLAAVALSHGENPLITLTSSEVSAGLPAIKAAAALAGQSGAIAILILLFLAVTSACSAEQIAVSSILTYDVYGTYINRNPTEKQIIWSSRICILGYSVVMGALATAFNYIGVSMGYLYELMGVLIGSAIFGIALCITWKKCNGTGAVVGAIVGFVAAIAGWLGITSSLNNGVISVETTFGDYEMLTGNLLAIGVGGLITVIWSLIRPANFDWDITRAINNKVDNVMSVDESSSCPGLDRDPGASGGLDTPDYTADEKEVSPGSGKSSSGHSPTAVAESSDSEIEQSLLQRSFRLASWSALSLVAILIFAIPLPLFFSSHVYSSAGFTAWVIVSLLWLFAGLAIVGIYPMWEARSGLKSVAQGVMSDLRRGKT
jgi:hypothetical protein